MNTTLNTQQDTAPIYPADCHLSIIVDGRDGMEQVLRETLKPFNVISALAPGPQAQNAGRYRAWRVSVKVDTSEELHAVDAALRAIPGVRMIL